MKIIFYDKTHKNFFKQMIKNNNVDCYNLPVIYLLGIMWETRKHFKEIYDIKLNEINPEVLKEPWQTLTTHTLIRLAFNLYNGFYCDYNYDNEELNEASAYLYTPYYLFSYTNLLDYFFQAVCIRFEIGIDGIGVKCK